jgi:hypothetical protein
MKKLLGYMVFAMVACGGSKPTTTTTTTTTTPETTTTTTTEPASAAAPVLTLSELAFAEGDDVGIKLHADGVVEAKSMHSEGGKPATASWKTFVTLTSDGKVMHDGKVGGQLKADGSFELPDGSKAPFKIDGTALVAGDKKITIDDKGVVQGTNAGAKQLHVTGLTDDGSRRAALLIMGIMFASPGDARVEPAHK